VRRWRSAVCLAIVVTATACSSAEKNSSERTPTDTKPTGVTAVPSPAVAADANFSWFLHPAANGNHVLLGVYRPPGDGPRPGVLLVHASGGLNTDYLAFARTLGAAGFDVVLGCWFATVEQTSDQGITIPCTDAPPYKGVVDDAVPDLDALVDGAHEILGPSTPLALVGFSRGAGIAALRATGGRPEPLVLVSGMYEGWNGLVTTVPGGEVDVVERVDGWHAPTLILHGTGDEAVPVSQAQNLERALRDRGVDVDAHYFEGAGHNLSGDPRAPDFEPRIVEFLCARLGCAAPVTEGVARGGRPGRPAARWSAASRPRSSATVPTPRAGTRRPRMRRALAGSARVPSRADPSPCAERS
jgi:dienelactone hydrolase